jgi:hypothetical protein
MTWHIDTIALHVAICKACGTRMTDTDPERLGREMDAHEGQPGGCG